MREYKMRRGEHLEERVEDMQSFVESYFGPVTTTQTYKDSELYVIEEPDNPAFQRVVAGAVNYPGKKDTFALEIEERPAAEVIEAGQADAAAEAVSAKNDCLEAATGRDAKSRRESMKRDVEDDAEAPEDV